MKRQCFDGNPIIQHKMHRKERLRQLQRLQQIRQRPNQHQPELMSYPRPSHDSERNLEIEKNNITLFNKIATILREKPKIDKPRSRHYVKSLDQAMFNQQKRMEELKAKNGDLLRRIKEQQPTIKNDLIARDRLKNERYLSLMSKYPFRRHHPRSHTEFQITQNQTALEGLSQEQEEVFREKSLDFDISIIHRPRNDTYLFLVKDLMEKGEYRMQVDGEQFKQALAGCGLSYHKLVGQLRLHRDGQMTPNSERVSSERTKTEELGDLLVQQVKKAQWLDWKSSQAAVSSNLIIR